MKKVMTAITVTAVIFFSCQKKAVPAITARKADPPKKFESIYPPKQTIPPDTIAGRRLFTSRCSRCHGLPDSKQFTVEKWENILPVMFPRAGMNNEEALHVRAYVLANSFK